MQKERKDMHLSHLSKLLSKERGDWVGGGGGGGGNFQDLLPCTTTLTANAKTCLGLIAQGFLAHAHVGTLLTTRECWRCLLLTTGMLNCI